MKRHKTAWLDGTQVVLYWVLKRVIDPVCRTTESVFRSVVVPVAAFSTVAAIMVLCGVAAPLTIWIGHQTQKRKQP